MLEMLHIGKAIHVVPRTEAESRFANTFLKQNALLGVGLENLKEPEIVQKRSCEKNGPHLIDGRGVERIAEIVEELL